MTDSLIVHTVIGVLCLALLWTLTIARMSR
jgi:hypothetical protein